MAKTINDDTSLDSISDDVAERNLFFERLENENDPFISDFHFEHDIEDEGHSLEEK